MGSALAEHISACPPMDGERTDAPGLGGLLSYTRERKPINKDYFNSALWKPALAAAEVLSSRDNGLHALRHYCALAWLEHGVSIKAVSEYLGRQTRASPFGPTRASCPVQTAELGRRLMRSSAASLA